MKNNNYFNKLTRCFLIAEIGVNHNGDINLAKEMISAAKEAGADAVKFQTFSANRLAIKNTPKVLYQKKTTKDTETHFEMLEKLELSKVDHHLLVNYCRDNDIEFLSTPYDLESAEFLNSLEVELFKTASADIVDLPLQRFLASTLKPIIVATGMASLGEIEQVMQVFREESNDDVILLHCVSNYPCSDHSINLRAMNTIGSAFQVPVGFSDHSEGFLAATLSVGMGAKVIEKHFTLDKTMVGPDHRASSTPSEFSELVDNIRRSEKILGSPRKICQDEETQMASVSRKSIVLSRDCSQGDVITLSDLVLRRPGTGLKPQYLNSLVGKTLSQNLLAGTLLKWTDLKEVK